MAEGVSGWGSQWLRGSVAGGGGGGGGERGQKELIASAAIPLLELFSKSADAALSWESLNWG